MSRVLAFIRTRLSSPALRQLLWWCLPALALGLVLRVLLMWQLPYAFFHDDAADFLSTPDKLFHEDEWDLHSKKTFLVPIFFTLPFLLKIPALIVIPVVQHLLGLGLVVLVGALCRLWFHHWRVFILPLTILTAVNPFFLWYEHTVMAESVFVFCTVLVALAGTLYAIKPGWTRFVFLCVALVLEAGGRPEGKLLFGFGIFLLILLHARQWRAMWPRVAALLVVAIFTHFFTKTSQAGLLLYTSVVRLTPTDLKVAPGFEPYIAPIRSDLQERWEKRPQFPRVRDRRNVQTAVQQYLKDHPHMGDGSGHRGVDQFCFKIARETCLRNAFTLPEHVYHKFRTASTEAPSGLFDNHWLFTKQREAYVDTLDLTLRLAKGLTGKPIHDEAELNAFIDNNYGEVQWLNALANGWMKSVNRFRLPDAKYPVETWWEVYPGVPIYFLAAAAGVIAVMFRAGTLRPFHLSWGLALLAFFYVVMLTANVRPRFRFVFEPFWFIYIALLAESLWVGAKTLVSKIR